MSTTEMVAYSEVVEVRDNDESVTVARAINPATIAAFAALGAQALEFAGRLIGGKTGDALSDIANVINGIGFKLQTIGSELKLLLENVQDVIDSIDKQQLARVWPVHSEVMAYREAFPQGVPAQAATNNPNYVDASARTSEALFYFQGLPRGPLTFMPTFCHVTNSRLEVAVNTWQCWWQQSHPAQPNYTGELNLSAGVLKSNISRAVPSINNLVRVRAIKGAGLRDAGLRGPDDPLDPQVIIGYQVIDDGKLVFSKIGDNVFPEANKVASQHRLQRRQQILGDFEKTGKHWVSMVSRLAPAGIQRALKLGDATQFLRYVNPRTLAMVDPADAEQESLGESQLQPLPLRDILLDVLTSAPMKEQHGLLVQGADRRSVSFWFDKTFHREPSKEELGTLMKVVDLFGYDALFGCLAYSQEYSDRYGMGGPGGVLTADEIPALEETRK